MIIYSKFDDSNTLGATGACFTNSNTKPTGHTQTKSAQNRGKIMPDTNNKSYTVETGLSLY